MKREDIAKIFEGATDEQINRVLNINSSDIGKAKADYENLKQELITTKQSLTDMKGELQTLKDNNANAADWEKKFNDLSAEIAEKERQAKADREAKEKADMIENRFNAVVGDRKFTHEAIKADYLHKFGEALDNKDFTGKSDADIFHELVKDDKTAFEGVTAIDLRGGNSNNSQEEFKGIPTIF